MIGEKRTPEEWDADHRKPGLDLVAMLRLAAEEEYRCPVSVSCALLARAAALIEQLQADLPELEAW
jgi:hypothetical protein